MLAVISSLEQHTINTTESKIHMSMMTSNESIDLS